MVMPKRSVADTFSAVSCKIKCQERGLGRDRGLNRRLAAVIGLQFLSPRLTVGDGAAALSSVTTPLIP